MAFNINIYPSSNITNMFENWLNGVAKKEKAPSQRGVCALLWAMWRVLPDLCLKNQELFFYMSYLWPLIEFVCGSLSSRWSAIRTWILGAAV